MSFFFAFVFLFFEAAAGRVFFCAAVLLVGRFFSGLASSSAAFNTSSTDSAKMNVIELRISSGTSSRS
ncbi:MAG: hypothetical protein LDL51_03640, partial [Chloroflexi bacterium]|nr:hypothetical protein [Chloroflexota bacterium]